MTLLLRPLSALINELARQTTGLDGFTPPSE